MNGTTWLFRLTGPGPSARGGHGACFLHGRYRIAVFGGSGASQDLWLYGSNFLPSVQPFGTTCIDGGSTANGLSGYGLLPAWTASALRTDAKWFDPAGSASLLIGLSNTSYGPFRLPLELGPYTGWLNCKLYVSPDVVLPLPTPGGLAQIMIPIPDDPALAGLTVYLQAIGKLRYSNLTSYFPGTTNGVAYKIGGT